MSEKIHVGDYGTTLRIRITAKDPTTQVVSVVDISAATALVIYLRKPDGTVLTRTAVFTNTGTDGLMEYVTVDGDIDQKGTWDIQGRVTFASSRWATTDGTFKVHPIFG